MKFLRAILLCLLCASVAHADIPRARKASLYRTEFGFRYFSHYTDEVTYSSPPRSLLFEVHPTYSLSKFLTAYGILGKSVTYANTFSLGVGTSMGLFSFTNMIPEVFPSYFTFTISTEFAFWSTKSPTPPEIYSNNNIQFRVGAGFLFYNKEDFYITVNFFLTRPQVLCIAPFFGVGAKF